MTSEGPAKAIMKTARDYVTKSLVLAHMQHAKSHAHEFNPPAVTPHLFHHSTAGSTRLHMA